MEVFEAIKGRRSIRNYTEKKIPKQYLEKIIEVVIWSPSGSNAQAWEYIVVDDEDDVKKIKMLSPGIFSIPAAIVIVCRDLERSYDIEGEVGRDILSLMDISMASQNIMLRAYDLGIGSCAVRSFGITAIKRLFTIPDYLNPELLITLGYPDKIPEPPKRRKIGEVVHYRRLKNV